MNQAASKIEFVLSITLSVFVLLLSCLNTKTFYLNAERGLQLFNFTVFLCTFLKPSPPPSLLVVVVRTIALNSQLWFMLFLWLEERCWTLNRLISNYSDWSEEKYRLKYQDQREWQEERILQWDFFTLIINHQIRSLHCGRRLTSFNCSFISFVQLEILCRNNTNV